MASRRASALILSRSPRALLTGGPLFLHQQQQQSLPLLQPVLLSAQQTRSRAKKTHQLRWGPTFLQQGVEPIVPATRAAIDLAIQSDPDCKYRRINPSRGGVSASAFADRSLNKLEKMLMRKGRGEIARAVMSRTMRQIKVLQLNRWHAAESDEARAEIVLDPRQVLRVGLRNATPAMSLEAIRRGGLTYRVPAPISPQKARWTSMKWLLLAAADKGTKEKTWDTLAQHLIDCSLNQGRVIKRKQDLHRQCEANKAYAHYRWAK